MKRTLLLILLLFPGILFAQAKTDSLEAILPSLEGKEKLEVLKTLTNTYLRRSYEKCIEYGNRTIELSRELNDLESEAFALRRTGYACFQDGRYAECIKHYKSGLEVFKELNNTLKVAIMADLLSNAYKETGDYDKSLEYFILGEKTGELLRNDTSIRPKTLKRFFSILYTNAGLLYYRLDSSNLALRYFDKALANAMEIKDSTRMTASLSNMGMVYKSWQKHETALEHYQKALSLARLTGNKKHTVTVLMNIGDLYDQLNIPDSAVIYTKDALELADRIGDRYGTALGYHNIAFIDIANKEYPHAVNNLNKSLHISKEIDSKRLILWNYEALSRVWDSMGKADSALFYFRMYAQTNEIVTGEETSRRIAETQVKYETEKKTQENIILKQEATINNKIKQVLYITIAALLLISIMLIIISRLKSRTLKQRTLLFSKEKQIDELALRNKETEKALIEDQLFAEQQINRLQKEKLDQKYRELSTVTLHIINKNEVLSKMLSEMEAFKNNGGKDDINTCFNKFSSLIRANLDLDNNWDQFKLHFEEVYPGFFDELKDKYPGLTVNEQKLCAYLKMKLSTKEISQMLNITIAAVNKSRNRLRKKLELQPEINLVTFLDEV